MARALPEGPSLSPGVRDSFYLYLRGPVGKVGSAASALLLVVGVVQALQHSDFWMWFCFAALALVVVSFANFHAARSQAGQRVVDVIREGQALLDDLGKQPRNQPIDIADGPRARRAAVFAERARNFVSDECPWLLPDFADAANAYQRENFEKEAEGEDDQNLTIEQFDQRGIRAPERRVEAVLTGLSQVKKELR